jgi:hypothetical protein
MCGLFGKEWAKLQEQHKPKQMGDSWQASICSFMIPTAHEFWTDRNSMMYDHDQREKITREEAEIISQVQHLYARQSKMSHYNVQDIFGVPIEKRLTFATATNKAWIIPTRREVIKRIKRWTKKLGTRQPDIRQFFTRKPNNNGEILNETIDDIEEEIGNEKEETDIES